MVLTQFIEISSGSTFEFPNEVKKKRKERIPGVLTGYVTKSGGSQNSRGIFENEN